MKCLEKEKEKGTKKERRSIFGGEYFGASRDSILEFL